ncbi:NifX-associated nitrogen fixation protein [Dolichospermum circinale CS-1225]|jgi:probable nitrogen fixation protein|uniref:Nitrogen fixation protein n=3 Tax=Dolichospermum TaxID=748770 RepID=A0A480ALQ9_9CYAN|nr:MULTISPECIES: NifX-associated nitrogen fixation protein [Nostocales]MDB9481717.1 NifX-associated nitrogen fixation protein [Dolichospermum circinale CS-537/05]MBD2143145.1 NifX-associated nitrogen fixation protein [Anabaena sp. FACHB-1250]MBD2269876.1 NifX-associated nitrogen fixation protein [Anabaena sp. FACHB-1391]MBE9217713.1 NifX-associated nitrogen fixation protein [Dolichospermum flos-aquae LEGE 04289]MDB9453337.1 NifX-associated nitrogen fixation protein [Dolichospermum circinale CS
MSTNNVNGTGNNLEVILPPFLKALVQQIRAQDSYGFYRNWTDELILKPYIVTKQKKREISVEGEVDPATISRINAFFRAVAASIEKETGLISNVVIELGHEGFGWALVFSGRLLLAVKTLRDAHRFGFDSFEKLDEEGTKFVEKGIDLAKRFPEVGNL